MITAQLVVLKWDKTWGEIMACYQETAEVWRASFIITNISISYSDRSGRSVI